MPSAVVPVKVLLVNVTHGAELRNVVDPLSVTSSARAARPPIPTISNKPKPNATVRIVPQNSLMICPLRDFCRDWLHQSEPERCGANAALREQPYAAVTLVFKIGKRLMNASFQKRAG